MQLIPTTTDSNNNNSKHTHPSVAIMSWSQVSLPKARQKHQPSLPVGAPTSKSNKRKQFSNEMLDSLSRREPCSDTAAENIRHGELHAWLVINDLFLIALRLLCTRDVRWSKFVGTGKERNAFFPVSFPFLSFPAHFRAHLYCQLQTVVARSILVKFKHFKVLQTHKEESYSEQKTEQKTSV